MAISLERISGILIENHHNKPISEKLIEYLKVYLNNSKIRTDGSLWEIWTINDNAVSITDVNDREFQVFGIDKKQPKVEILG